MQANNPKILDIGKVLESRSSIVHDEKRLIGADYKSVFSGNALINWMLNNYNPTNTDREGLEKLLHEELFSFMLPQQAIFSMEGENFFRDSNKSLYRFIDDQYTEMKKDPNILNLNGADTSVNKFFYEKTEPMSLLKLLEDFKIILEEIYAIYLDESKTLVDYKGIEESEVFNLKFLALATELAYADLSPLILDIKLQKAFFINVYNIMIIHSFIVRSRAKNKLDITTVERPIFNNTYKYCLGGYVYTLGDIEHGVFRGNSSVGVNLVSTIKELKFNNREINPRFKGNDPRTKFVLRPEDPRAHFALNSGTKSGPALRYYDAAGH